MNCVFWIQRLLSFLIRPLIRSTMNSSPTARELMHKGKKVTAEYIKNNRSANLLQDVLNYVLCSDNHIDHSDSIEWIKWLMAGGCTPEEFTKTVKKYNNARSCGLVWTANFYAFRCRTCGISPCMSLCGECFQGGQHEGHDFNMFRSQAGGACDCGDASVMRPGGFCKKHGVVDNSEDMTPPPDLLYMSEIVIPRIFCRLIIHFRKDCDGMVAEFEADDFLGMLSEFSEMGAAMRRVLTFALTSKQCYKELMDNWARADPSFTRHQNSYLDSLSALENPDPPEEFKDCLGLQKEISHETFLEELVFWTIKFEFPQKVVCFLLNMLPDLEYKDALTESFVMHYSRIAIILEQSADPDTLSNRVVHISVQLFSNEELAIRMTKDFQLLEVMVVSLKFMMSKILVPSQYGELGIPSVVDCSQSVMKEHSYWPLVSDLNNILSHRPVALQFMGNETLPDMWFKFLSYFQGMNVNKREMTQHIEFEPNTYYAAFSAELEASAYPMWALLSHLKDKSTLPLTLRMLKSCEKALENWLGTASSYDWINDNFVSFHLPLHRYLATFICQAINIQGESYHNVVPSVRLLEKVLVHPLRVQAAFYEIINGLWIRNGVQIKGQAMTYIQCNFCNSMVDADLYLLQICAMELPAHTFFENVIARFHIKDWLSFSIPEQYSENEMSNPMIESFLQFLATLTTNRTNLGIEFYGGQYRVLTRLEMVTLLCTADRTHSQLMELMPERCGTGQFRDFDAILSQVAEYRAPNFEASGNMQQGLYTPQAVVWETLYDPVYVLLRAVQRRDFQNSMDRFTKFVKQQGSFPASGVPWPPFRIPSPCNEVYRDPRCVLNTRLFHSVIWIVFYKAAHTHTLSEHILSLAVYLLELVLADNARDNSVVPLTETLPAREVIDSDFSSWYSTDSLSDNLRTVIKTITLRSKFSITVENPPPGTNTPESAPSPPHSPAAEATNSSLQAHLVNHVFITEHAEGTSGISELIPRFVQNFPTLRPVMRRSTTTRRGSLVSIGCSSNDVKSIEANESIISLLLRLHSKLSGRPDSFDLDQISAVHLENRIGDGPAFIGKVLTRIWYLDEFCSAEIRASREMLWPQSLRDADKPKEDIGEVEMKKRLAHERRLKIMEKFANMQKAFMENNKDDLEGDQSMDWEGSDNASSSSNAQKEYDCVICVRSSPSTVENPIGLVVLVQATSVLARQSRVMEPPMPINDFETRNTLLAETKSFDYEKRVVDYTRDFDELSWWQSTQLCLEGGIHVQTCGHHLHLECLKSYLTTLRSTQQRVLVDRYELRKDEYLCPLCRQLANSVLPMPPDDTPNPVVISKPTDDEDAIFGVGKIMKEMEIAPKPIVDPSPLMNAMKKSLDDMINSTYPKFLERCDPRHMSTLFLFVNAVARTNLEVEVVQRGGSLCSQPTSFSLASDNMTTSLCPSRSCIMPLMNVLSFHARVLSHSTPWTLWQKITGIQLDDGNSQSTFVVKNSDKDMPLLLADPTTFLVQFFLLLPLNIDESFYTIIVKCLYNLQYFQIITKFSSNIVEEERNYFRNIGLNVADNFTDTFTLSHAVKLVLEYLVPVRLYLEDGETKESKKPNMDELEARMQNLCLPFLRIAAIIRHYMFQEPLPEIVDENDEFASLVTFVKLASSSQLSRNPHGLLTWPRRSQVYVRYWLEQLAVYTFKDQINSRSLVSELHTRWYQPRLLMLPTRYEKIFQYYHQRPCGQCNLIPAEGSICLVCGTLVCLKQNCCQRLACKEAVQHSIDCGAGTAMFLIVTTSYVVVIRGKRACFWGSVYLDSFGEEDCGLKRGKPLLLSKERYKLLENQWLSHRFDHTNKHWILHRDNL